MDKNMINIDNLIRQRLDGAEEREPSGSWLSMKELLDENDKRRRILFPWKGIFSALLTAGALSVGGYWANQYFFASTNTTKELLTLKNTEDATSQISGTNETLRSTKLNYISKSNNPSYTANRHLQDQKSTKQNQLASSAYQQNIAKTTAPKLSAKNTAPSSILNAGTTPISTKASPITTPGKPLAALTKTTPSQNALLVNNTVQLSQPSQEAALPPVNTKTRDDHKVMKLVKDTITQIIAKEYTLFSYDQKVKNYKVDTIAIERVPRERWVALAKETSSFQELNSDDRHTKPSIAKKKSAATQPVISYSAQQKLSRPEQSAAHAKHTNTQPITNNVASIATDDPALSEGNIMVPLAKQKVSDRQYYLSGHSNNIKQMLDRAKSAVSQIHFYPGLTVGANTQFTHNGLISGFHAGLTGLFAFYQKWSLMLELKYLQNFNNGQQIYDPYIGSTSLDSGYYSYNGNTVWGYELRKDSIDKNYKFSMMQSLNLPITLRYAVGRFDILAGLNLNYYLPIKTEDAGKHFTIVQRDTSNTFQHSTMVRDMPTITLADFGSRFGVGYVFGASYQFTPAVNLDLRMTKMFWDNATTEGEKRISNQLFKAPNVQLSIGYRFGQAKNTRR